MTALLSRSSIDRGSATAVIGRPSSRITDFRSCRGPVPRASSVGSTRFGVPGIVESLDAERVARSCWWLELLAARPNVICKLSGPGTFVDQVQGGRQIVYWRLGASSAHAPDFIDPVTATSLELFGSRRWLFGADLPVEKVWTDSGGLAGAWFRRAVLARTPSVSGRPERHRPPRLPTLRWARLPAHAGTSPPSRRNSGGAGAKSLLTATARRQTPRTAGARRNPIRAHRRPGPGRQAEA